jgi:hypothetical protein
VYTGGSAPQVLFEIDFVRDCWQALGIAQNQLVQFDGPIKIPRITIAEPSFEENHSAFEIHHQTMRSIAERLIDLGRVRPQEGPVYISKEKLKTGVRTIANEAELTGHLQSYGFYIISPEVLRFKDQLSFWASRDPRDPIFGFSSSAFHSSVFIGKKRLCTISHDERAWSNQVLIDLISGNETLHIYPIEGLVGAGPTSEFSDSVVIKDPRGMASDLARLVDAYARKRTTKPQSIGRNAASLCQVGYVNEPFGENIARQGSAGQSSNYSRNEGGKTTVAANGALSGHLTGVYQSCTDIEPEPWWQVDLGQVHLVYEVRLFNRCDVAMERLTHVRILLSTDGAEWRMVSERKEDRPFGGLRGDPHRWLAPPNTKTRFVRIQIPETDFLSLDQVEIFGERFDSETGL